MDAQTGNRCWQLGRIKLQTMAQGLELPGNHKPRLKVPQALRDLKGNYKCRQLSCCAAARLGSCCPGTLCSCRPCRLVECVCQTLVWPKSCQAFEQPFELLGQPAGSAALETFQQADIMGQHARQKRRPSGPRQRGQLRLWAKR